MTNTSDVEGPTTVELAAQVRELTATVAEQQRLLAILLAERGTSPVAGDAERPADPAHQLRAVRPADRPDPTVAPEDAVEREDEDRTDRRQLLRRAGAATAGVIAGGVALTAGTTSPAAAAAGGPMILGVANSAPNHNTSLDGPFDVSMTQYAYSLNGRNSATYGVGVYGESTGESGVGIRARSDFGAAIRIVPGGYFIPPGEGDWSVGALLVSGNHLYYCYQGGFGPGTKWAKLSGAFVPYDGAVRAYDSRPGTTPVTPQKTRFANHEERTLDLTVNDAIAPGTSPTAVVVNLTATNTNPGGYFSAWRSTIPWPGTSSVNWGSANTTIANQSVIKVNGTASIKVRCEGAGGADLVVDVVGYYI